MAMPSGHSRISAPAKSGEAEQGEWVVEVVAGPAQPGGDVGVAGSVEDGDDQVVRP